MSDQYHMTLHEYAELQRSKVVSLATSILSGKQGIVSASRELTRLQKDVNGDDEDFMIFRLIDSETDHLPLGLQRDNYRSEVLKEKDREIAEYEEFYKDQVLTACRRIIDKFEKERHTRKDS